MMLRKKPLLIFFIIVIIIVIVITGIYMYIVYLMKGFTPSAGVWQYVDDDLEITVFVPEGGGISTPAGFSKCKAEIMLGGEKQKAILAYHVKMYQFNMVLVGDYSDIMKLNIEYGSGNIIISSTYLTPMKKGEWEFKDIRISEPYIELLRDYDGKNLILKRIGDYKEPE